MRLVSRDGQLLNLEILGYQFPLLQTEPFDSNWLRVRGKVVHPRGFWTFEDPCLLTYEVAALADWLEKAGGDTPHRSDIGFTEPNLEFRLVYDSSVPHLRIYFELESRPPWAASKVAGQEDLWVQFSLVELDLNDASQSLRKQLEAFPQRAAQ